MDDGDDDDVSSFVCRRNGWQADDQGSLLIIAVVPLYHRPDSVIKIFAHTLESVFSRVLSVSSIARMFYRTLHTETAVHLKRKTGHRDHQSENEFRSKRDN